MFPPALKKGMVLKVDKKGHFQRLAARQKGTLSARQAKSTFLSDLWHAGRALISIGIRFNTVVTCYILYNKSNLLFSFCSFLNFHISGFSFTTEKIRKFLFPHFFNTDLTMLDKIRDIITSRFVFSVN